MTGSTEAGQNGPNSHRGVHYPALDGLRGVAILWVMTYHLYYYDGANPLGLALRALFGVGWAGVDLFFAISGFLITGILLDSRGEDGGLRRFFIRRALRIAPAYYAVITLLLLTGLGLRFSGTVPSDGDFCSPEKVWIHYLYLSNFAVALYGEGWTCFDIAWSLAVEEQFYLVLPFIVAMVGAIGVRRVMLFSLIAAPILRLATFWASGDPLPAYVLLFCRMDALAFGGMIALSLRGSSSGASIFGRRFALLFVAGALALSLGSRIEGWFVFAGYSLVAMACAAAVARVVTQNNGTLSSALQHPWLRHAGQLSYGLYLWHLFAREAVDRATGGDLLRDSRDDFSTAMLRFLLCLLVSFALARMSWVWIETPFLRLKGRLATRSDG